ncbi:hypothetical protein CHLRE_11g467643v5 [Chlamydomonas reinhardtii]|uniref:Uncharacterized protein n=1 Tax=Chlamydomonas reinhardtii TaxID=3055 RepID=A8JA19_CHLRE|nr:uncharacterized protein CHLRE_11g467643v5 [Chlamydomonas reinhardtii]PNW76501.1 hypothetical protein CHLRE_11g467643v5 [Chlamydomonas reinhardtii]|eukprot:XP_001698807.1 predicted protein [Chlamydomonas reinhardtii]
MAPGTGAVPSGRRLWTLSKVWIAARDVPEVAVLAALCGGALAMGFYTYYREMWTPAGESFPSVEVRRDPEKQTAVMGAYNNRSMFYHVAQWKHDDKGYSMGVFDNRSRPFEYNLPTQGVVHSGPQYETESRTQQIGM